ncbi:MAG: carboxylate-amine ligase [Anaerolineae bacterium]|nr:carboxylate-amine ligase [Anaerolineae bacterium]
MYRPPLTLGVEEEYMIVDAEGRALTAFSKQLLDYGKPILGDNLKAEFMQCQIEIGTPVCRNVHDVRDELRRLRKTVNDLAAAHGRRIGAASTHPFSRWQDQVITQGERYQDLYTDMQDAARRLLIFGMHIHVGLGDDDKGRALLIDIMNQMRYFLPHILALTTSSPFWHGRETGLKSYRSLIFQNMPRTGIPPVFTDYEEYDRLVDLLAKVGSLGKGGEKDASRIWWDIRPNSRVGTLEMRVADMCTTIEEAVCVTAVIQALVAKLVKLRTNNQSWRLYRSELLNENKWRAARYGVDGLLIDFGIEEPVHIRQIWSEILTLIDDVVDELGSREEIEYVNTILEHGTSADRQIATYHRAIAEGHSEQEALIKVMDNLLAETVQGT